MSNGPHPCYLPGKHQGPTRRWVLLENGDTNLATRVVICAGHEENTPFLEVIDVAQPQDNPTTMSRHITKLRTTEYSAKFKLKKD